MKKKNKTETAADGTAAYAVNYTPSKDYEKERDKLRHLASDLRHMRDSENIGATKKDDNRYCNLIDQALDVIDDRIKVLSTSLEMLDRVREESK